VNRKIDAVCFDVDGTLYSIRRMVLENLRAIWPMRATFRELHRVRDLLRLREHPVEDFRQLQAERFALEHGGNVTQAMQRIEEVIEGSWMDLFAQGHVRSDEGMAVALRVLQTRGLRLALMSDYPIEEKPGGLGLADIDFSVCINAEDVGALKPHPRPFLAVAEALDVAPGRILYVGDREAYDVEGALGVGMLAARIYRKKRPQTRALFAFKRWALLIRLMEWKRLI